MSSSSSLLLLLLCLTNASQIIAESILSSRSAPKPAPNFLHCDEDSTVTEEHVLTMINGECASHLLFTTYYSIRTTHHSILSTQYSILNTQYSILNTQYILLTTHYYSPLTPHYSLLTTHYTLLTTHYLPRPDFLLRTHILECIFWNAHFGM